MDILKARLMEMYTTLEACRNAIYSGRNIAHDVTLSKRIADEVDKGPIPKFRTTAWALVSPNGNYTLSEQEPPDQEGKIRVSVMEV